MANSLKGEWQILYGSQEGSADVLHLGWIVKDN